MTNSVTQIRDLHQPIFRRFFTTAGRHILERLNNFTVIQDDVGIVNFSVFPPEYLVRGYDEVNDHLQNTLQAVYRPTRTATAADVSAGLTKTTGGAQVPVVVGDIIVDPSVPKVTPVVARRRRTKTATFGVLENISAQDLGRLKFSPTAPLLEQMRTTIRHSIESILISALYGFSLNADGSSLVPGLDIFFTNTDGRVVAGSNVLVGYGDYSGTSLIAGSNTVERGLLGDSILSDQVNRFSFIDVVRARAAVIQGGKLTQDAAVFMMVHPHAIAQLVTDSDFIQGISKTSSIPLSSGFVGRIGGATIISSPHCATDIITVFSANAIGVAFTGTIQAGMELNLEQANSVTLGAWVEMGAAVLREEEIFHIRYRTS